MGINENECFNKTIHKKVPKLDANTAFEIKLVLPSLTPIPPPVKYPMPIVILFHWNLYVLSSLSVFVSIVDVIACILDVGSTIHFSEL